MQKVCVDILNWFGENRKDAEGVESFSSSFGNLYRLRTEDTRHSFQEICRNNIEEDEQNPVKNFSFDIVKLFGQTKHLFVGKLASVLHCAVYCELWKGSVRAKFILEKDEPPKEFPLLLTRL